MRLSTFTALRRDREQYCIPPEREFKVCFPQADPLCCRWACCAEQLYYMLYGTAEVDALESSYGRCSVERFKFGI
jgi:hypothetical protein